MATVADYYKTDFSLPIWLEGQWNVTINGKAHTIDCLILTDFVAKSKYMAVYFGKDVVDGMILLEVLNRIDAMLERIDKVILGRTARVGTSGGVEKLEDNRVKLVFRSPGDSEETIDHDLRFTGRVYFYSENRLAADLVTRLEEASSAKGISLICRGPEYAATRDELETPRAFISHDSRDKEDIARVIATTLRNMLCPVWFDEFFLRVGDSLRESIEHGLKTCRKCIFILTPNFLSKGGWPKREYDAIFTRELVEDRKLILPVWAGVSKEEVYEYSPILADRVALHWKPGEEKDVCRQLFSALVRSS
jgi:hypothetical protein